MFTQDDAERALNAVATYLNCEPETLEVVRGDPERDMIVVQHVHHQGEATNTYIYQCSTAKVYPVNGYEDPEMTMDVIVNSRAEDRSL